MAHYLIGDIQGCNLTLGKLLETIDFSPSKDTIYLLGDLINRGPDNVGVLRRLMSYGSSAKSILGNHDLHFLSVEKGIKTPKSGDTIEDILNAKDRSSLTHWLRTQPLALMATHYLLVHAGVHPMWSAKQTIDFAREVQVTLSSPDYEDFLKDMYGNEPSTWDDGLKGMERLRLIVNVLTRMRFCSPLGQLNFNAKSSLTQGPQGFSPWFEIEGRKTQDQHIGFGHWSTAGGTEKNNAVCVDTGCVWGKGLSAFKLPLNSINDKGTWFTQATQEVAAPFLD
ncbi:MAG: symmetrical bis(5'-nucleosyl)-tetraphosphatase [Burkholderiaceae bacterium]|jgi:bis(5'-nucleosyl)-tetraphosphatase (symmetrical)